jgi:predicted RNase H-like HicB family nuclease
MAKAVGKANTMINNFWSFSYIVRRFKEKAEEYGIKVVEVGEYKTSSRCPFCRSENITTNGRLFKCLDCGLEAHRDAVGALNIGCLYGGSVNGVVAHPLLLRWDGVRWEPKRTVNNQPMNTLEARISRLQPWRMSMLILIIYNALIQCCLRVIDLERKFTVILKREEDGGYSVRCLKLPAAISQGETREEALENIKDVITLVLQELEERALKINDSGIEIVVV